MTEILLWFNAIQTGILLFLAIVVLMNIKK